ncbi:MAG: LytTR family transcriptional regulator [Gammaproteobacteria bacterium]|nr:LytTR family transcriptional regulator [Gammaproteobacteria bacterium]
MYLKQGTIAFYEEALESSGFVRIHRSIIINKQKIQSISGPNKGQFWINLGDNHEVRSSRKYQNLVEQILPKAI